MIDLDALKRLAEAASKDPWDTGKPALYIADDLSLADAEFIAAANPQTVLWLVERIQEGRVVGLEAAEARIRELEDQAIRVVAKVNEQQVRIAALEKVVAAARRCTRDSIWKARWVEEPTEVAYLRKSLRELDESEKP